MASSDEENVVGKVAACASDKSVQLSSTSLTRKASSKRARKSRSSNLKHQPRQGEAKRTVEPNKKGAAGTPMQLDGSEGEIPEAKSARFQEQQDRRRRHHNHYSKRHQPKVKESKESRGSRRELSDDSCNMCRDAEEVPPEVQPKASPGASVSKTLGEHDAASNKPPISENKSQPESDGETKARQASVTWAQKLRTGPLEKSRQQENGKGRLLKDFRPYYSMAAKKRRTSCSLAGCLVPATIVCVVGVALYVAVFVFVSPAAMAVNFVRNPSPATLHQLCSTPACLRAMDAMTEYMEDVDPCSDFQRHVCGKWFSRRPRRESYEQEATDLFLTRIHQALQERAKQPVPYGHVTREYNMAKLYDSCLNFMVQDQRAAFVEVLESMGIGADTQQSIRSPADLFRFIVGTSISTGLPCVVSIKLQRGYSTSLIPVVDMGQTLVASLHYVDVAPYLEDAVHGLQIPDGGAVVRAATKIDKALEAWRVRTGKLAVYDTMRLGELRDVVAGARWTEALNAGLLSVVKSPQFTANSTVMIKARGNIYGALATVLISQESIANARDYVLLLLLAQVMKYRYLLERPLERTLKDHGRCLYVTAVLSSALFPAWVTHTLVATEAIDDLRRMMDGLKEAILRRPTTLSGLNINDSEVASWAVYVIGSERSLQTSSTSSPPVTASSPYDDRFLLNVVRASRDNVLPATYERAATSTEGIEDTVDIGERRLAAWQIRGKIASDTRTRRLLVPAVWLSDLMFVRDSSVPTLDIATLGVRLLAVWIRAVLAERPHAVEKLKAEARCPSRDFGAPLDEDHSDEVTSTVWALRIALQASQMTRLRNGLSLDVLRERVFFWRFCQSYCGDVVTGGVCEFSVRGTERFQDAFLCRELATPQCWA